MTHPPPHPFALSLSKSACARGFDRLSPNGLPA